MKRSNTRISRLSILVVAVMLLASFRVSAQETVDTTSEEINTIREKVSGIEERITNAEADLAKLTKIKLSGYIQAQWLWSQNPSTYPANYFMIRRARLKVQYEPINGVAFVLQPDFIPGSVSLKDAYAQVNDPWLKVFSLWAGQFNRPNYEVEYSSSSREIAERSLVIRTLYPGERAIGAKLEYAPHSVPLKIQVAFLNGNDALTITDAANANVNPVNRDYDNFKDIMARATYGFKFGNSGALNIGANGYFGYTKAFSTTTLNGKYELDESDVRIGSALNRSWFGVEAQLYLDFLGGLALKGEFLMGTNAYNGAYGTTTVTGAPVLTMSNDTIFQTTTTTKTNINKPNSLKPFMGYYVYLIKNIGKRNQFAIRYDYYDPNTDLKGSQIGELDAAGKPVYGYDAAIAPKTDTKTTFDGTVGTTTVTKTETSSKLASGVSDIAYGTISLAWNYYFSDNIKFMINYDIPMNEKVGKNVSGEGNVITTYNVNNVPGKLDYSSVYPQGLLTVRLQVKF